VEALEEAEAVARSHGCEAAVASIEEEREALAAAG
jgi:hypothetical protein